MPPETVSHPPAKRPRWRRLVRWLAGLLAAFVVLNLIGVFAFAAYIIHYGSQDRARPADVIVVLGGGQDGTRRRTAHAVALYKEGYASYLLCSGGAPPGRTPVTEAERCATIARKRGVPTSAILLDNKSVSTEENALNAAEIMRAHHWTTALVVSDDYHLWRAHWMFERAGVDAWTSPAQVTDGSVRRRDRWSLPVLREIAASAWYATKTLLGLPYTHVNGW